ncbi:uncharacterized protein LOC111367243 [Olea europaea var. sylvestris]|uniref:uncharacterized protein LOC111367243 n=1 Tax=Olea europaea var. sylvestris TaxID=158386 RepID=UPI000C1D194C|nr:uncharacterized protein LOC111367243 [Olea europaea var. sylvestris]
MSNRIASTPGDGQFESKWMFLLYTELVKAAIYIAIQENIKASQGIMNRLILLNALIHPIQNKKSTENDRNAPKFDGSEFPSEHDHRNEFISVLKKPSLLSRREAGSIDSCTN